MKKNLKTLLNERFSGTDWKNYELGQFRSNGKIKNKEGFLLYIRRRNLKNFIDDFSKKSSNQQAGNQHKHYISSTGSSLPLGIQKQILTPDSNNAKASEKAENSLPVLSVFSDYPSLMAVRKNDPCLLIGFDSEWETLECGREMLSWQFALVDGADLVEFVFFKNGDKNLNFEDAISSILDYLGKNTPVDVRAVRRYKYCTEWKDNKPVTVVTNSYDEAKNNCKYYYHKEIGFTHKHINDTSSNNSDRDLVYFNSFLDFSLVESIKINIVCHAGKVDLSTFIYGKKNLLNYLKEIQNGLVTLHPVKYAPKSLKNVNNTCVYPISLSVSDTMCHTPVGKKKLKDMGEVIGVEKIEIYKEQKEHMKQLLINDPVLFTEYASTDSIVTLLYASSVYGYNNSLPVTITSAAASVMKNIMMKYLGCTTTEEFDRDYRGLEKVNHGKHKLADRPGYVEATNLEPISNDVNTCQFFSSHSFHGGYNICTEVGYFPYKTWDYDSQNAYPTAMCLVPDIYWKNPIKTRVLNRELTLDDFTNAKGINPITPFVGYVRFEFPSDVKYPCIPINVDGIPVYPRSSEGMDGVYAAGPYIWLALKLGAKVYCVEGYFLNVVYVNNYSKESRSLAHAVKQLVVDRNKAKRNKGKGSLEELILKVMVNSVYGKNAQNVIQKTSWDALKDLMEDLGCSSITNPFSATMITSIVQVELIAAQNQIHNLGYMSCSVTTDGFISNCPEDVLKSLDLYGLKPYLEEARAFLTDGASTEIWEIKHHQDDLVNFTTRGNVSLYCKSDPMIYNDKEYEGVCAHNSAKSGYESDSYEDRYWLMTQVLSRTGTVDYTSDEWTTFKELVHGKPFVVKPVTTHIHMDFDMKRKPIRDSFTTDTVFIDNQKYTISHFKTEPFNNISEFRLYRSKKAIMTVLRTEDDWNSFWSKVDLNECKAQPRNLEWAILNSCIMGYRAGRWDIPALSTGTVEEKCAWINSHNESGKTFKPSDWKNARRPERQSNMLPTDYLSDKLSELGAVTDIS